MNPREQLILEIGEIQQLARAVEVFGDAEVGVALARIATSLHEIVARMEFTHGLEPVQPKEAA